MFKALKAVPVALRYAEKLNAFAGGATSKTLEATGEVFKGPIGSVGIVANVAEAIMALIDALEASAPADKLRAAAVKQAEHTQSLEGKSLAPKQIMAVYGAIGAEYGTSGFAALRRIIQGRASAHQTTVAINDRYFGLKKRLKSGRRDVAQFL